ncbi:hypothetical protein DZS_24300 [Dickeya ananatis]
MHPGHTPGSAFYTLTSEGEKITFVGDLIHIAAVQFPQPNITIAYDEDQDRAAGVRIHAFEDFARNKSLIAAPHLPFPGIGYVARNEHGGYAWVPVTYTDRAASVVMSTQSYAMAPPIVAGTDLLCTLPRRMLQRFAQTLDIFAPPVPLQPIVISMYWHPKNSHDPANVWLRAQLLYAAGLQP